MSIPKRLATGLAVAFLGLVVASETARAQALIGGNGLNNGFNGGFVGNGLNNGFNGGFVGGGVNNGFAVGGFNNNGVVGGGFAFGTPVVGGFGNGVNSFGGAVGFGAGQGFYGGSGYGYGAPIYNTGPATYNNLNGLGMLFDSQVIQKRSSLPPVRRRRR
jgi:hypothetical protein